MSLHMIFTIIQLLPLRTPSIENAAEGISDEGWTYWIYLLSSRGIYSILVSLILFCCLINAIQNKFGNKENDQYANIDVTEWVDKFWKNVSGRHLIACSPIKAQGFPRFGFNSFDVENDITGGENIFDKIITAEGELEALRNAVEMAQKVGSDLEENVEEAEKDKDDIEGRKLVEKQWINSEIEFAQKDMESLKEQLEIIQKEKEQVVIKCQNLQEEAQKAGDALQRRQKIQEKLDEALTVVSVLKQAVADLEADRDEALESLGCVLPDLPVTQESREKLSKLVNRNLRSKAECTLTRSSCVEDLHMLGRGDDLPTSNHAMAAQHWVNYGDQGYGEMVVSSWSNPDEHCDSANETPTEGMSEKSLTEVAYDEDNELATENIDDDIDDEQIEMSKTIQLTSSAAFRQFLQSNFGQF